jgi:O-antigen ligase
MVIVAIAGIFVFSGDTIQRSFKYVGEQTHSRAAIYETTLEMIRDAPVLGMGLGTYPEVFQIYRKSGEQHRVPARKAHNTYLENAAELGIPAAFILVSALGIVFLMCIKGVANRRRNVVLPAIGVGATVLLGLHSIVDFSLQIPGIAASYAFILGLACAQSESTGRQRRRRRTTSKRSRESQRQLTE